MLHCWLQRYQPRIRTFGTSLVMQSLNALCILYDIFSQIIIKLTFLDAKIFDVKTKSNKNRNCQAFTAALCEHQLTNFTCTVKAKFAVLLAPLLVTCVIKVRKSAKIRNRYNLAPYLTQDTNGKVTTSQLDITNECQEVSLFPSRSPQGINKQTRTKT